MVDTDVELDVDDARTCVSEGSDGSFMQTWTWVQGAIWDGPIDSDGERCRFVNRYLR